MDGALLRNRTVDLLLTIHHPPGSVRGKHVHEATNSACPTLSRWPAVPVSPGRHADAKQHPVRAERPGERQHLPRPACRSGPAHGMTYRPDASPPTVRRRSSDLRNPPRADPEGREQEVWLPPGRFEPAPLSDVTRKPTAAAHGLVEPEDHTAAAFGTEGKRTRPPERGRHPNLPKVVRRLEPMVMQNSESACMAVVIVS
jgi:hypothetical protein